MSSPFGITTGFWGGNNLWNRCGRWALAGNAPSSILHTMMKERKHFMSLTIYTFDIIIPCLDHECLQTMDYAVCVKTCSRKASPFLKIWTFINVVAIFCFDSIPSIYRYKLPCPTTFARTLIFTLNTNCFMHFAIRIVHSSTPRISATFGSSSRNIFQPAGVKLTSSPSAVVQSRWLWSRSQ